MSSTPNRVVGQDLPSGTGDNSFGQGTTEDDVNVHVGLGSIPNSKADLARFAVAMEFVGGNYAFQGGSNTPTLTRYTWTDSAWGNQAVIGSAFSEGAPNAAAVSDILGTPVDRPPQQFGEVARRGEQR